jgi:hypothetical protein
MVSGYPRFFVALKIKEVKKERKGDEDDLLYEECPVKEERRSASYAQQLFFVFTKVDGDL